MAFVSENFTIKGVTYTIADESIAAQLKMQQLIADFLQVISSRLM